MTREQLIQEVAGIINSIPQCDGATFTHDLEEGAKEIVDTFCPQARLIAERLQRVYNIIGTSATMLCDELDFEATTTEEIVAVILGEKK